MTEKSPWSKDWIFKIDPGKRDTDRSKLDIFPLQFANCERLERHDAVYLFDEVGCGKTISAGLMALHYLYKHPDKKVLVITVNALVTTGKLKEDWKKLPFDGLGLESRFEVINNDYRNIEAYSGQDWGLVIIDEAHLFLNQETKRHTALCSLKAEKAVFLTATPVKDFRHFNMSVYADIADSILEKTGGKADRKWIDRISTQGKEPKDIICQTFSLDTPVTRYFKDTVKALKTEGFRRIEARRLMPDIWSYSSYEKRFHELAQQIETVLSNEPEARFVIFVRYIEDANAIGDAFVNERFHEFQGQSASGKSFKIVTGTSADLSPFCKKKEDGPLPTALIITYQLAEQGVDLPGYSHVVNVHIPAYPSALEQRFGRIDRMNSDYFNIKMHFFLGKDHFWDSNTMNLDTAIFFYLTNLISYLPAKNVLLTSGILEKNQAAHEEAEKYLIKVEDAVRTWAPGTEDEKLVKEFCQDHGIPWSEEDKTDWVKDVDEKLKALRGSLASRFDPKSYSELLDICTGDKVFYFTQLPKDGGLFPSSETVTQNIHFLDAVDCAERINANEDYQTYYEKFKSEIEPLLCFVKYQNKLERWYEELFRNNQIEEIFCPDRGFRIKIENAPQLFLNWESVCQMFEKIESQDNIPVEVVIHSFRKCWQRLPFFQMCAALREILKDRCRSDDGYVKRHFRINQFVGALGDLTQGIWTAHQEIFYGYGDEHQRLWLSRRWWTNRLSDDFYEHLEKIRRTAWQENPFYIENRDGKRLASNWLRLVVHLTANELVYRKNGEKISVLDGFLYSESGERRSTDDIFPVCWWHCAPNLPQRSSEEDWWTYQI